MPLSLEISTEPASSEILNGRGGGHAGRPAREADSLGQGVHGLLGGQCPLVMRSIQEGLNLKALRNTKW